MKFQQLSLFVTWLTVEIQFESTLSKIHADEVFKEVFPSIYAKLPHLLPFQIQYGFVFAVIHRI